MALRAFGGAVLGHPALRAWTGAPDARQTSVAPVEVTPEQRHIEQLAGVVKGAARHGERAQACHDRAAQRIDAALYELDRLREELAAALPPEVLARLLPGSKPAAAARLPSQAAPKPAAEASASIVRAAPEPTVRSAA